MTRPQQPPVQAAGALCWKHRDGELQVLLVGRARNGDISLPKGKAEPGELLPQTAVREVEEETGIRVRLGAPLGEIRYTLPGGRAKTVQYWAAKVRHKHASLKAFTPNGEITTAEWASVGKARKKLSYSHDVEILDEFADRFENRLAHTFPLVLLRHGNAVAHEDWDGADAARPLLPRGEQQSVRVAPALQAFGPKKLITSDAVRCVQSLQPLAGLMGTKLKQTAAISQDAYESGEADARGVVRKRLQKRVPAVLCSHGPVLPEIVRSIAREAGAPMSSDLRRAASLDTGAFSVLHLTDSAEPRLVAVETFGPSA
ncbi:NUDIX domain-containing protein [Lysobacter korlensis]|uniref:NUDIX domain-containing protein n=1 Tax=Lysobacter korlensis TaxID=553636 RepID=A0ABV6RV60_9GAMM